MKDLLVCIRCHDYIPFVMDTLDSIYWSCGKENVEVVVALDRVVTTTRDRLISLLGEDKVFYASKRWGWGVGLWCMLVESLQWFEERKKFQHFMSVDYDTLVIAKDFDTKLLSLIDDENIGLVGRYATNNSMWYRRFEKEKGKLAETFGRIPPEFIPGEGVQGGCMLLTRSFIEAMKRKGMFRPPYSTAKSHTTIADDHLIALFVRMCGLNIVGTPSYLHCQWKASTDPRGLEKKGVLAFHPTKLRPGPPNVKTETDIRNYFRKLRGRKPL